jgi:hypothetical protein
MVDLEMTSMWSLKRRKQREPAQRSPQPREPEEQASAETPDKPTSQQDRIMSLYKSRRHQTALEEILRSLRQDPDDFFLLRLGATIAGVSRSENLRAAEPTTSMQRRNALLAPVVTQCSSCGQTWFSAHWASPAPDGDVKLMNPAGLQCQNCRYTLCRDCLHHAELSPGDPIDSPTFVMGFCPEPGHGELGTPVLATGRKDIASVEPDRIEAVIVTREGPIPPAMDEALGVVTKFVPLIADDAPLIHIRASKPGLMADESGRDQLALARIHDLEREGILAVGAWNRSERMCVTTRDASDANYLLTVVRKEFENGLHPLYSLHAGMSKQFLAALLGSPESLVSAGRGSPERRFAESGSKAPDSWLYHNAPPGIDTELVIANGVLVSAEMKDMEDGYPLLRVTGDGTFTPIVGHAVYALMLLLSQMPKLDEAEIARTARQLSRNFREAAWQSIPRTALMETAANVLRPWSEDPGHGKYILVRENKGVLVVNDAPRICGFWMTTDDRIALCLPDGSPSG